MFVLVLLIICPTSRAQEAAVTLPGKHERGRAPKRDELNHVEYPSGFT